MLSIIILRNKEKSEPAKIGDRQVRLLQEKTALSASLIYVSLYEMKMKLNETGKWSLTMPVLILKISYRYVTGTGIL